MYLKVLSPGNTSDKVGIMGADIFWEFLSINSKHTFLIPIWPSRQK